MGDDKDGAIVVSPEGMQRIMDMIENPPEPNERLRAAVKRHQSRNAAVLDDFVRFCSAHPDLRFWQALSAWTKSAVFVLRSGSPSDLVYEAKRIQRGQAFDLRDTFYWEGKDG